MRGRCASGDPVLTAPLPDLAREMLRSRSDRPRVVHVVPAMFGDHGIVGGAERYVFELATHMATRVPTSLVSYGPADREFMNGALRVRVLGRPWRVRGQLHNPLSARLLPELARADVVHFHQQHLLSLLAETRL